MTGPLRVIFLDIDGVMNTPATWGNFWKDPSTAFTPECVRRASKLVVDAEAIVVISSTWRRSHPLPEIRKFLAANGFEWTGAVVGITPITNERRALQIRSYLRDTVTQPYEYVVLDDDTACDGDWREVEGHVILVNASTGLSDADCVRALQILKVSSSKSKEDPS